jgi:hypothetical protein
MVSTALRLRWILAQAESAIVALALNVAQLRLVSTRERAAAVVVAPVVDGRRVVAQDWEPQVVDKRRAAVQMAVKCLQVVGERRVVGQRMSFALWPVPESPAHTDLVWVVGYLE